MVKDEVRVMRRVRSVDGCIFEELVDSLKM